jgi:fucose 4-O-acetylase-like acetyltransferase
MDYLWRYHRLINGPLLNSIMFFIAGFFAFGAYQRKGSLLFIKDKLKRLGIPYLGGLILLSPLTHYIAKSEGIK